MSDNGLSAEVRALHRRYPSGVTIVTVMGDDGAPHGLAVNAFSSVSLEPPLILVAVNATTSTYPWLFTAEHIAVNIIAQDQANIVKTFATSGGDKFAGVDWREGEARSPILEGTTGHFELAVRYKIPAYTHTLFIGEVISASYTEKPALVYVGGAFYLGDNLTPAS
jgi:flavin reductase (DIM6/NTAB) family NADH-FMN oxidoreductase RutF